MKESALFSSQKKETLVILIHEIYGINEHIRRVCNTLELKGYAVLCADLLGGRVFSYNQEAEAYSNFKNNIGFEAAAECIMEVVKQEKGRFNRVVLLGYSVGATIAWLCSERLEHSDSVIGFYGSRIRDYMGIVPKCPVLLFFPENEKSFDPAELQKELLKKQTVTTLIFEGNHGFADPFSERYHEKSANETTLRMEGFLESPDYQGKNNY